MVEKKADIEDMDMFCYQCEQTDSGVGCMVVKGVCGKTANVATLQDLIIHILKKIARYLVLSPPEISKDKAIHHFFQEALFSTLTNVNFDESRMKKYLVSAGEVLKKLRAGYIEFCKVKSQEPILIPDGDWVYNEDQIFEEGKKLRLPPKPDEICSTKNLSLFGIKGMCAYAFHALQLGREDEAINSGIIECFAKLDQDITFEESVGVALKVGELNLKVLAMLDQAHTDTFGHPEATSMKISAVKGKCILITGHDLKDLEMLLKQTEGKGINVYTHGEMLPANSYPKLKAFKHLIGNYGGPWQEQQVDFQKFPGPILVTTNCIIEPKKSYINRIFTRSAVGFKGVAHIPGEDFSPIINCALKEKGFLADEPTKEILMGFGHHCVLGLAELLIDAIKAGAIKHIFLVGGCDGYEKERTYFTDLAMAIPKDCIVLTLACGKYRFNKLDFGAIEFKGKKIPRLLDMGQCNDSFSAVQVAVALADAFKIGVNDLPLHIVLSWFEQKAVAVLLTLLHLNIKNMMLGPRLPAFLCPKLLDILIKSYGVKVISTVDNDLKIFLGEKK